MPEKQSYIDRVHDAIRTEEDKRTKMSLIIDAYDQQKTRRPDLGTQQSFSEAMTEHITGALRHGHGLTLYRYYFLLINAYFSYF